MHHEEAQDRSPAIRLGVKGWDWPDWEHTFYPPGMPPDWQLTFYNTQFQCVFVPEARWRGASVEELSQWAEDTHDQFLFLLEGDEGLEIPAPLLGKARGISPQDVCIIWFDAHTDLKELAGVLRDGGGGGERFVLAREGDLAQIERVRTLLELLGVMA